MAKIDELVYEYYETPGVAEGWTRSNGLLAAEQKILDMLAGELAGSTILDIGVGPGRTTEHLTKLARHYIGADYSHRMLLPCRARYPDVDLLLGDARELAFKSGAFDIVFFLFNALDDAGHEDRLRILSEIHRVLRPGASFVFAAHNLEGPIKSAYRFGGFVSRETLRGTIRENSKRIRDYWFGIANHTRRKQLQVQETEYSIINDSSFRYGLLTYYMSKDAQIRQLLAAGFDEVRVFNLEGGPIEPGLPCHDKWLHYVARKRVPAT